MGLVKWPEAASANGKLQGVRCIMQEVVQCGVGFGDQLPLRTVVILVLCCCKQNTHSDRAFFHYNVIFNTTINHLSTR